MLSAREYYWRRYCDLLDELAALNAACKTGKWAIFSKEDSGHVDRTAESKRQASWKLAELKRLFIAASA